MSNMLLARFEQTLSPDLELSTQLRWSNTDRDAVFTMPSGYASATQQVTTLRQAYARENQTVSWLTNLTRWNCLKSGNSPAVFALNEKRRRQDAKVRQL